MQPLPFAHAHGTNSQAGYCISLVYQTTPFPALDILHHQRGEGRLATVALFL